MNEVKLSGKICTMPELRATQGGYQVCRFKLAVEREAPNGNTYKSFIPCQAWGKTAENISGFAENTELQIEGRLNTRSWQRQDGSKAFEMVVVVERYKQDAPMDVPFE